MFKVNKKIEYALMALKHMSTKEDTELTSVKELCDSYKMPFDVMSKVMQKMASGGILQSEKGAHGGYYIQENLNNVSVLGLYEAVMNKTPKVNCQHKTTTECSMRETCNVISPMAELNSKLIKLYETIAVSDLLKTS